VENNKMEELKEIKIHCKDCGRPWTIRIEEQKWYKEMGFELPKRCFYCRQAKRRED